ncbi:MAG: Stp1/IreP family PP2C-type Ser/Thr phosphatase [Bacilli bacterium]|nr:Stp1/IreP family PP2C-type Ser/Thr phosphatase [Bacilli bacterium]
MKDIKYQFDYAYQSDVGRIRLKNEDSTTVLINKYNDILLAIADGMGGHNKGDYASHLAISYISEEFKKRKYGFVSIIAAKIWLQHTIGRANKLIFNTAEQNEAYHGMGTTLVAVLIRKNYLIVINIGDSRAYLFANNKLEQLCEDQSYVNYLKNSGQINESEAQKRKDKNILLNALGIYPSVSFESRLLKYNDQPVLLCSDGLCNNLKEINIIKLLQEKVPIKAIVNNLINAANANGGNDNITVIYFKRSIHG